MSAPRVVAWRCECGKTLVSNLDHGKCPYCDSAFERLPNGNIVVIRGSWEVLTA